MDRRTFIKDSALLAGAAALASCTGNEGKTVEEPRIGEMTYRKNPGNGDTVSILGYGCMRWPSHIGDSGELELDQNQINRLVERAMDAGVNYYDTAPVYCKGKSERTTGIALAKYPRRSYHIATKLSNFSDWSYDAAVRMYKNSLEYLQTDYLDYYLLHSLSSDMEEFNGRFVSNGVLDYLMKERAEGRIRNLGFSFHGNRAYFDALLALHDKYHWDFVQIQMNYVDWSNEDAEYQYRELEKLGIPVVIMEPLLGGRLASVPEHIAGKLLERESARSIASWAFRFCGSYDKVLTVLSGMTYMEHLEDNLKSYCPLVPLNEEELSFLGSMAQLIANYPTVPCTACEYCMPCPYGIDIPGIFRHYNKCVNEGDMATKGTPEYRRARRRYLASYSREIMPERQADKCIGCEQCRPKCPQKINITRQLMKIDKYVENLKKDML